MDLYLRAGNAGAMANAVPFLRDDGEWLTEGPDFIADIIGPIILEEARFTRLGVQTFAPVVDTGFHINLRCSDELAEQVPETVRVHPATPRRLWA